MKLLADVNVNEAYVVALRSEGHTVRRVAEIDTLTETASDSAIIDSADDRDAVVVTSHAKEVQEAGGRAAVVEGALVDPLTPRIEVLYKGARPDRLRDKAQPIVRGRLLSDGRFRAEEILLTCPSRYKESSDAVGEGT